ncbi:IS66 family insertion sequence element accessory protein TnpB [Pseudomonas hunanensis]|uniref:IS66 family insertion sequence element accessory protein TnpB n=1 Tax=Pseudomonas hunanensis TaxID=1247546 RepID=UPI003CFEF6EE
MMRPDAKVEKVYLHPKPVDFRKSIDGLATLVEHSHLKCPTRPASPGHQWIFGSRRAWCRDRLF